MNKYTEWQESEEGKKFSESVEMQNKPTNTEREKRYMILIARSDMKYKLCKNKTAQKNYADKSFDLNNLLKFYRLGFWQYKRDNSHN